MNYTVPVNIPTLTYTITGFVNGETASVLTGEPFLSTSGDSSSYIGLYPIEVSLGSLASSNYTFSFFQGVLDISDDHQVITFPIIPDQIFGSTVTLEATASSHLPVTYTVISGNATISGNVLTILGSGTITVAADQAGDQDFHPAEQLTRTFICIPETPVFTGQTRAEEYLFKNIRTFSVFWVKTKDINLASYKLYRDDVLIQTFSPSDPLVFNDYGKHISDSNFYSITAINLEGQRSATSTVSLP